MKEKGRKEMKALLIDFNVCERCYTVREVKYYKRYLLTLCKSCANELRSAGKYNNIDFNRFRNYCISVGITSEIAQRILYIDYKKSLSKHEEYLYQI